jgi:hypothetical protein
MLAKRSTRPTAIVLASVASILMGCWFAAAVEGRSQSPGEGSFLLEQGRAGQFEIGMTVDEVVKVVGKSNVLLVAKFPEGIYQPELHIQLPGYSTGPALTAPILDWPCGEFALWGISVHDPRFRTRNGLGIGSTLGELKKFYPSAEVTNIDSDGEPGVHIADLDLTFAIGGTASFTNEARVTSVWVVPQPGPAVRARHCPGRTQ